AHSLAVVVLRRLGRVWVRSEIRRTGGACHFLRVGLRPELEPRLVHLATDCLPGVLGAGETEALAQVGQVLGRPELALQVLRCVPALAAEPRRSRGLSG